MEEEAMGLEGAFEEPEEGEKKDAPTLDIVPVKKRQIRNPIPKLNPERILGPKGLSKLEDSFIDFKFRGEGHERQDLEQLMRGFEHWAHVLFPQRPFNDVMGRIAQLGKKREVQVNLNRLRLGMRTTFASRLHPDDDDQDNDHPQEPMDNDLQDDEFQRLVQEAEAEDEAREDENITSVKTGIAAPDNPTSDAISEELLRKYDDDDSSNVDDDECHEKERNCVARTETKEQNDDDGVERNSPNNDKKRLHLSESDSEEEDGLHKRKKTGNVLDSSDEE